MTQSSINSRLYKAGSIIYFEGDKSEFIYILKSGRLILKSINLNSGAEITEGVKIGEFFGVKSALGKYPREETAQTIDDTVVLVLTLQDFEKLVLKNVEVIKKMLRVFSNQLRRIHKNVRSAMGPSDNVNPAAELYKIGEYYYKAGIAAKALYAFKKYLDCYPGDDFADEATKLIVAINKGQFNIPSESVAVSDASSNIQGSVDSFEPNIASETPGNFDPFASNTNSSGSGISNELSNFLSNDPFGGNSSGF